MNKDYTLLLLNLFFSLPGLFHKITENHLSKFQNIHTLFLNVIAYSVSWVFNQTSTLIVKNKNSQLPLNSTLSQTWCEDTVKTLLC